MAGDWIKMRGALLDHPKVIAMARALQANREFREWLTPGGANPSNGQIVSSHALRCVTTALLMRAWSVAREHGKFVINDLILPHSTVADLDEMAGAPGVGEAMSLVGWAIDGAGLRLPNFIEFNVPMTNAEKQAEYRKRKKDEENALPTHSNERKSIVTTRVEKSREDKKQEEAKAKGRPAPLSIPESIADVWADWHAYRNASKGWTHKARELSLRTLTKLQAEGHDPRDVVDQSIERSWTGLFPIKGDLHANRPSSRKLSAVEQVQQAIHERREREGADVALIGHG